LICCDWERDVRPDDHPGEQIPEDHGLPQTMKDHRREGGDAENQGKILQERVRVVHQASGFTPRSCRMSITMRVSRSKVVYHSHSSTAVDTSPSAETTASIAIS
jgi:hypothetical protein